MIIAKPYLMINLPLNGFQNFLFPSIKTVKIERAKTTMTVDLTEEYFVTFKM
jgi:hypothetical protein